VKRPVPHTHTGGGYSSEDERVYSHIISAHREQVEESEEEEADEESEGERVVMWGGRVGVIRGSAALPTFLMRALESIPIVDEVVAS